MKPVTIIFGKGIIGLSIAEELSRRGHSIVVAHRDFQCSGEASWAAAGYVSLLHAASADPAFYHAAAFSFRRYPAWCAAIAREAGAQVEWTPCGSLSLWTKDRSEAGEWEIRRALQSNRLQGEWWDKQKLFQEQEGLAGDFQGAFYCPQAGFVHPWQILEALGNLLEKRGVEFFPVPDEWVFERDGRRVLAVDFGWRRLETRAVIIAAGAWSGRVSQKLQQPLPIRPVKGHIALMRGPAEKIRFLCRFSDVYIVPRKNGELLIGSTFEDEGFDAAVSQEKIDWLIKKAVRIFPELKHFSVERVWAGFRPTAPDGWPILSRLGPFENAWVATGHFGFGYLLAPFTAKMVAQALEGRKAWEDLASFRWPRPLNQPVAV